MATPDVRVRLSAEGTAEVLAALRKVQAESQRTAQAPAKGFAGLNSILASTRNLIAGLGLAVAVSRLLDLERRALDAADSLSKMGQRVGASAENVSALAVAAKLADVETSTLEKGLGNLAKSIDDLRRGSPAATAEFKRFGLTVRDFRGKDTVEGFVLLSEKVAALKDDGGKAAAVMGVLGDKVGRQLIPLLNEAAGKGLGGMKDQARALGLLIDSEIARSVQGLSDSFKLLELQILGAATQFLAGFGPSAVAQMSSLEGRTQGVARGFRDLGRSVGEVIAVLRIFLIPLGAAISNMWIRFAAGVRAAVAITRGDLKGAFEEIIKGERTILANTAALPDEFKAAFAAVNPPPLPEVRSAGGREVETEEDATARVRREAAERERLADRRLALEDKIRQAQGRGHESVLLHIALEAREFEQVLLRQGVAAPEAAARAAAFREALEAQAQFQIVLQNAGRQMDALEADRKRIEADVSRGLLTQQQGEAQILALERARIPALQAIAGRLAAAADVTTDPESIAKAERFTDSLHDVGRATVKVSETVKEKLAGETQSALSSFLSRGIIEARSFGEAILGLATAIVQAFQQVAAQIIATQATKALFSSAAPRMYQGGLVQRFGVGGLIRGPGTGTSDSVLARVSAGEFVVRASSVSQPGAKELLEAMNAGMNWHMLPSPRGVSRFAEGGLVGAGESQRLDGSITIRLGEGLEALDISTPVGQRKLIRVIHANRNAIRRALG